MATSSLVEISKIRQWIADDFDVKSIREEMTGLGYDDVVIETSLKEFRKIKYAKRQSNGFICLGIGAVVGFLSCVLAIINPFPDYFYWMLYGFTTIAILLIFAGLIFLLE